MPEMIAPDFVAWAVMQHYRHHHSEYYNIIRSKIIHFDDLSTKKKKRLTLGTDDHRDQ